MKRARPNIAALVLTALLSVASARAAPPPSKFDPPAYLPIAPLTSGTSVKPVSFTKVATLIPGGETWAIIADAQCKAPQSKTWTGHATGMGSAADLKRVFQEEAQGAGFQVSGGPADLFEAAKPGTHKSANLKVGALITGLHLRLCAGPQAKGVRGVAMKAKGSLVMTVEWQIYSKSAGQVLAKITTDGGDKLAVAAPAAGEVLRQKAFAQNTRALFAQDGFRALILGTDETPDPPPARHGRSPRTRHGPSG